MTYNPAIPAPEDILADSQSDLLTNSLTTDTGFTTDHVALSSTEDNGKHKFSRYRYDSTINEPSTDQTEMALYPLDNGNGIINLLVKYQEIGVDDEEEIEAEPGVKFNAIPFASSYFTLAGAGAVTVNGTANNLSAVWATNIITCTFTTNAANTNYFVRLGFGNSAASAVTFGEPSIVNRALATFQIVSPFNNFVSGNEFYVFVYEVP